jgi:hypothetical protein
MGSNGARSSGPIDENPAEEVKGVDKVQLAPRSLKKREADRLVKCAKR